MKNSSSLFLIRGGAKGLRNYVQLRRRRGQFSHTGHFLAAILHLGRGNANGGTYPGKELGNALAVGGIKANDILRDLL